MSNQTTTWSSEASEGVYDGVRRAGRFAAKGLAVILLAGMGAFVYTTPQFLSFDTDPRLLLVPVFVAGVFAHLFANSLRRSVRLGLTGYFGSLVLFMASWVAPLWILPYSPAARDLLLPSMMGKASAAFFSFSAAYLTGYLLTVSIAAFWE